MTHLTVSREANAQSTPDEPTQEEGPSTRAVHAAEARPKPHHSLTDPLFQTSTYTFDDMADAAAYQEAHAHGHPADRYEYGRYGNPSVAAAEARLAALENADAAIQVSSGMAAITTTLFALLNLALILGTGFVGMRLYWRGHPDFAEVKGSRLLSARVRAWYFSNLAPFEQWLVRTGVRPITLTYLQVVVSMVCALAYARGLVFCAGFLVLFTGTLDILDGKVARRTNGESPRGAFLDSVMDRYAEFVSYAGLMVLSPARFSLCCFLLSSCVLLG